MKRFLIGLIVLIALAAWIIWNPPEDGGYLLMAFGSYTIEMSLWLAALILFAALFTFWLLWRVLWGSWSVAKDFSGFIFYGSSARAQKRAEHGLIDFIEGNWLQAHKKLVRSAPRVQAPLINYLAAARSAHEMHDREEVNRLLDHAAETVADSELAIALTRARIELEDKHYDQCLLTINAVKAEAPLNPVLLDLEKSVYVARQEWQALRAIFDRLRRQKVDSVEALNALEITMYDGLLRQQSAKLDSLLPAQRLERLNRQWQEISGKLQREPRLLTTYTRQLVQLGDEITAEQLLRKYISRSWQPEMVYVYGTLRGRDLAEQMRTAEAWKIDHPQDPILLAALGRLSLRMELWGKARDYFLESLQIQKDPEVYAELARLSEFLGEQEQSKEYYRAAIALSVGKLPVVPSFKK